MPTTAYNPLAGRAQQLPVGLGALTVPALASLRTGIPAATTPFRLGCGQGPPLTVDGRTYPTSVSGTVRDLTDLTPLPLHLCTRGTALALPRGPALAELTGHGRTARRHRPEPDQRRRGAGRRAGQRRRRARPADRHLGGRVPHRDDRPGRTVLPGGPPGGQPGLDRDPERAPAHPGHPGRLAAGLRGPGRRWRHGGHDLHPRDGIPLAAGRVGTRPLRADRGRAWPPRRRARGRRRPGRGLRR